MGAQLNELSTFQQNLYDLERAHQQMKIQYEEEIMRLRRELDGRSGIEGYAGILFFCIF